MFPAFCSTFAPSGRTKGRGRKRERSTRLHGFRVGRLRRRAAAPVATNRCPFGASKAIRVTRTTSSTAAIRECLAGQPSLTCWSIASSCPTRTPPERPACLNHDGAMIPDSGPDREGWPTPHAKTGDNPVSPRPTTLIRPQSPNPPTIDQPAFRELGHQVRELRAPARELAARVIELKR